MKTKKRHKNQCFTTDIPNKYIVCFVRCEYFSNFAR